jgi:hypothetical protein
MTFLSALGEFPEMVLGFAFSLGCALLLGFVTLRLLLGLMTRQQFPVADHHNEMNDPGHARSILWLGAAVAGASGGTADRLDSGAIGGSYLVPAATPGSRFIRDSESDADTAGAVVQLPHAFAGRIAQGGLGNNGDDG